MSSQDSMPTVEQGQNPNIYPRPSVPRAGKPNNNVFSPKNKNFNAQMDKINTGFSVESDYNHIALVSRSQEGEQLGDSWVGKKFYYQQPDLKNDNIAINNTNLQTNDTPDLNGFSGGAFKLPPIKGSKTSMGQGLTNNYYKRDKIRMARSFLKEEQNMESSPDYAGPNFLDEN